jgi:photosystem II stability/assembly factor-like uncharacterized protein
VIRHNRAVRRPWIRFGLSLLALIAMLALAAGAAAAAPPAGNVPRASPVLAPAPAGDAPAFVKQFEETSYYLEDLAFITPDVAWAVGQVHWDAARKQYAGTIVKTTDGGKTWAPQNAGVDESLRGLSFLDENQGWAVGVNGAIVHTADGGQHWARQAVDTTDSFRGVVFVDPNNGWATSIKGVHRDDRTGEDNDWQGSVWHTGDGGQTWGRQSLPESASLLNRIDFVDSQHGWAVGLKRSGQQDYSGPQHAAAIYRTTDGGQTWAEAYAPDLAITLTGVDFVDADNGWVVGFPFNSGVEGGFAFHTSDGGQTWERENVGGFNWLLRDVKFVDLKRGYIFGGDYVGAWGPAVYRTLDGGKTWTQLRLSSHNNENVSAVGIVGDRLIAVGEHDYVVESDRAWAACESKSTGSQCNDCDCLFTASYINTHYRLLDVFFTDAMNGWTVGSRSYGVSHDGQVILHTADGGATWDTQYTDAPPDSLFSAYRLTGVYFSDPQTGWAVGASAYFHEGESYSHRGAILHTADGGKTWKQQGLELYRGVGEQTDRDREFVDVHFLDNREGWALARSRYPDDTVVLAHTTDAGEHWTWVNTGVKGVLFERQGKLAFTDAQHGWVAAGQGLVLHTEDGGAHWSKQEMDCGSSSCNFGLYALDIPDGSHGAIAGEFCFHTPDGGAHWSMLDLPYHVNFFDVQLIGGQSPQGWMAGDHGVLLHTDDGGKSWSLVQAGLLDPLFRLHFVDAQHGWFVGDYGAIVRYVGAQLPSGPVTLLSPIWRPGQVMSGGAGVGVQVMYVP